ncbi:hypothetical protein [Chryseobacterium sp.]|uniref:hypothetical protein n=1 Tax=Chryseobacterium sp. TaxID=1871047 RepID=UPI00289D7DDD|nr:hypothetical protein [Chryseobacterium sp.]
MKYFVFTFFILVSNSFYTQTLDKDKDIDLFLKSVVSEDDLVYGNEISIRIQYINDLNKKILINHIQTPDYLVSKLSRSESSILERVYQVYISEVKKMEMNFIDEQKFKYKNLTPKSRICKLLLIDQFKNYPNSYTIISNNTLLNLKNTKVNDDLSLVFQIYRKYNSELSKLVNDVESYQKQFVNFPIYYPNWEQPEKIDYYNKIDAVLWCYLSSKSQKID